jgi:hypothetical protein
LSELVFYYDEAGHSQLSPLLISLYSHDHVVREQRVGIDPQDNLIRATFSPIPDSSSLKLEFELTAPDGAPDSVGAPYVTTAPSYRLRDGSRQLDVGIPVGLRYGVPASTVGQLGDAVDRASQYRPQPLKGPGLWVLSALAMGFALVLIIVVGSADGSHDQGTS